MAQTQLQKNIVSSDLLQLGALFFNWDQLFGKTFVLQGISWRFVDFFDELNFRRFFLIK